MSIHYSVPVFSSRRCDFSWLLSQKPKRNLRTLNSPAPLPPDFWADADSPTHCSSCRLSGSGPRAHTRTAEERRSLVVRESKHHASYTQALDGTSRVKQYYQFDVLVHCFSFRGIKDTRFSKVRYATSGNSPMHRAAATCLICWFALINVQNSNIISARICVEKLNSTTSNETAETAIFHLIKEISL